MNGLVLAVVVLVVPSWCRGQPLGKTGTTRPQTEVVDSQTAEKQEPAGAGSFTAESQAALEPSVRNGFHHGRVLMKSQTNLAGELETAVQAVLRYQEAGVHIADGGDRVYPTISPREEDLIRRGICAEENATGVDLTWWSATSTPWGGWTKTLVGRFFLRKGRTHSLHHFFKLATADGAANVSRDARIAGLTHRHVKVIGSVLGHSRSLLVTQSAGKTPNLPTSLTDLFALPPARVVPSLGQMASAIADQVGVFGDTTPDQNPSASCSRGIASPRNGGGAAGWLRWRR